MGKSSAPTGADRVTVPRRGRTPEALHVSQMQLSDEPSRGRYLHALRARWIYVVATAVVTLIAAGVVTLVMSPRYEAGADVLVDPVPTGTLVGLPVLRDQGSGSSVVTAARLAKSPQVAARARATLGLASTPAVTVTPQQQSNIVTISGSGSTAEEAARIANAFAQALISERSERYRLALDRITAGLSNRLRNASGPEASALANQLAAFRALSSQSDPTLEIVSPAVPPNSPSSPKPLLNLALAAVIGLLFGAAIVLGIEIANPRVLRAEALTEQGRAPILARMPRPTADTVRAAMLDPYALPTEIRSPVRALWGTLGRTHADLTDAQTILVASADSDGDAGPTVAAVLAALISRAGGSVALIDADLERGPLAAMVDEEAAGSSASLGELVASGQLHDAFDKKKAVKGGTKSNGLRVLLVQPQDRVGEWLSPYLLSSLVANLKNEVDTIVIAAPPPPAAELTTLVDHADAVVVAVELGVTRRDRLGRLIKSLAEQDVAPTGFVVLDQPPLPARIADASASLRQATRRWV